MTDLRDREQFLNAAVLCELGLVAVAFFLGWLLGINPMETVRWTFAAFFWGVLGTLPMLLLFGLTYRHPFGPLLRIKQLLIDYLGPPLAACRWYELILLSILVGFSEELLFRGLFQSWLSGWGQTAGLVGSNILFGLAHAVTPAYSLLAGGMGLYLGLFMQTAGEGNLLVPMIIHGLYDYVAFLVVARAYRIQRAERGDLNEDDEETPFEF